jgi:hypothetical protein
MKIFFVLYTLEVYNKVLNIFICNLLLTPSFTEQIKVLLRVASGCCHYPSHYVVNQNYFTHLGYFGIP